MAVCCSRCRLAAVIVDMNRSPPTTAAPLYLCPVKPPQYTFGGKIFGFELHRKERPRRRLRFAVAAELSRPSFSLDFGLDSQTFDLHGRSQLPWIGPVPGDIAEVEAYCRIFRNAERVHIVLMDTLCHPLTGECSVSYSFKQGEKPLMEDEIVSVLGCMVSLLNKGRSDVLSGRSSIMSSFRISDLTVMEDKVPPLAVFRSEMKRCCETLHVALEKYLVPDDDRSLDVWRKLQRLKNVCYDSGFPRGEDAPCHTLFANWSPVHLVDSNSREGALSSESDVAFWCGGQVTEEGLKWLINRGFRTIVDLRDETVRDEFYGVAVADAIESGKIDLVKIPVEVGTAPSIEQVEMFASLVSNCRNKPIYLHSKEGVWRTSAMVSRWRQYMTRCASQSVLNRSTIPDDMLEVDSNMSVHPSNGMGEQKEDFINEKNSVNENSSHYFGERFDGTWNSNGAVCEKEKNVQQPNGVHNNVFSAEETTPLDTNDNGVESVSGFSFETDPLQAQVPACNIFSRKEMSQFFRTKKISPPTYFTYQLKVLERVSALRQKSIRTSQRGGNGYVNTGPGNVRVGSLNGSVYVTDQSSDNQGLPPGEGNYINGDSHISLTPTINRSEEEKYRVTESEVSASGRNYVKSTSERKYKNGNGRSTLTSGTSDIEPIEGDMCASTTGVVRVQSRKKAEMFLVRTDGFSCAREKVTEASLAFTHPSTQQQMLMWKSTPKTVLLLKKLGNELMEEAKEVASFLYHQEKMNVLVEPDVHDIFARIPGFGFVQTFYIQDTSDLHERVDFVACLGGDGVILHASNLFRGSVPPVVSFNLGSLGFLTSHTFDDYGKDLRQIIHGNNTREGVYITLRMRLRCQIFRNGKAVPGKVFDVLNEVVVDRGSNPYLSKIECFEHDRLITKVQGDGVIVATPTGSTAYSTAAGGSMVHPNVPCMLFTPICPHSLSFRPVILPDSARLELKIPDDARSNAWVSFDGKRRQQLSKGDSVRISMSEHPLPTVNKSDQTCDWFHSLIRCLNWNERLDQKAL